MDLEKLKNIQERLKEFQKPKATDNSQFKSKINPFTIAIDLVAATIVGVAIGLMIDKFFNTRPLFLILCILIGIIAGFNMIRQKLNNKH